MEQPKPEKKGGFLSNLLAKLGLRSGPAGGRSSGEVALGSRGLGVKKPGGPVTGGGPLSPMSSQPATVGSHGGEEPRPVIPTLRDSRGGKSPDLKIKGMSALSLMDRVKQFKRKDLAFIMAGVGVLFMAPLAEHFMLAPESSEQANGAFKEGWGFRDASGALGKSGGPFEGGYNGLAPGSLLGGGGDIITPLNVRDPSALVMGPGATQQAPVSAPPTNTQTSASASSSKPSSDWKDALANAASKGAKEATKAASLPVPKIPLQGGLRGLGALGGGGGGGSFSLAAPSAGNVPNSAAGSNSLTRAITPNNFKGVASRGPSVGGGGLENLKKAAANAAGEFNKSGGAARDLDSAAAASQIGGGEGGGSGAPGGSSAQDKATSQNNNAGGKSSGESLDFLMRKSRMEKELEMETERRKKNILSSGYAREQFASELAGEAIKTILMDGIIKNIMNRNCITNKDACEDEKKTVVVCNKGGEGCTGPFSTGKKSAPGKDGGTAQKDGYCVVADSAKSLGMVDGSSCKATNSPPGCSGCATYTTDATTPEPAAPQETRRSAAEEERLRRERALFSEAELKNFERKCEQLQILARTGRLSEATPSDGSVSQGERSLSGDTLDKAKRHGATLRAAAGKLIWANDIMLLGSRSGACGGPAGGTSGDRAMAMGLRYRDTENVQRYLDKSRDYLVKAAGEVGAFHVLRQEVITPVLGLVKSGGENSIQTFFNGKDRAVTTAWTQMTQHEQTINEKWTKLGAAKTKAEWDADVAQWKSAVESWNQAKGSAEGDSPSGVALTAKELIEKGDSQDIARTIGNASLKLQESVRRMGQAEDILGGTGARNGTTGIGGYEPGKDKKSQQFDPATDLGTLRDVISEAQSAVNIPDSDLEGDNAQFALLRSVRDDLKAKAEKANRETFADLQERYNSQAEALRLIKGATALAADNSMTVSNGTKIQGVVVLIGNVQGQIKGDPKSRPAGQTEEQMAAQPSAAQTYSLKSKPENTKHPLKEEAANPDRRQAAVGEGNSGAAKDRYSIKHMGTVIQESLKLLNPDPTKGVAATNDEDVPVKRRAVQTEQDKIAYRPGLGNWYTGVEASNSLRTDMAQTATDGETLEREVGAESDKVK